MIYFLDMGTNVLRIGLLITTVQFLFSASCNKDETSCLSTRTTYSFIVTSEWSPQKEVYNVGDTIYLTSVLSKTLVDQINPSLVVDYNNSVGINGDIGIVYLDTITHQPLPAKDSFDFISIFGNFKERSINMDLGINIWYTETSTTYQFKGAIVCKRKGIYGFTVSDLLSPGLRGKNCTKAGFSMSVTNIDKHLYLHQYALNVNPSDPFLQQHGYDFKVH